jgi:hypothetical protein
MMQVVVAKMMGKPGFEGDFVLSNVDNPLLHGVFHHFIFLFSQGPFSQTRSDNYDQRFPATQKPLCWAAPRRRPDLGALPDVVGAGPVHAGSHGCVRTMQWVGLDHVAATA